MRHGKKGLALMLSMGLALFAGAALAATETTFEGAVVSGESVSITAPFGGTLSTFGLREGSRIAVGDTIATIETTKVYATANGTISGVFGQVGDSVEDVTARYGTVLYISPEHKYSITADIEKAYNSSESRYVNIGETVYISCTSDGAHTAQGILTAVNGTSYTVESISGELLMGETVNIYRGESVATKNRIGRGEVSRTSEIAVNGSGSILTMHVRDGDTVARGDILFETVTGTLDGLYAVSNQIISDVEGIIASIDTAAGSTINKGATLITVYPSNSLQIEISIAEYDLSTISEGDTVTIGFNWDENSSQLYEGTVAMISHVSESSEGEAAYKGYVNFVPTSEVRLGMTVVVYTQEDGLQENDLQEVVPGDGLQAGGPQDAQDRPEGMERERRPEDMPATGGDD